MAKKGFDLGELARQAMGGSVSDHDTRPELRLIPFDRILPDPDNGYSLDGIEDLAGNIETVGLLDPLVVRPETEAGFPLTSGHRRHAAIRLIIEGGSHLFDAGVPCIVRTYAAPEGTDPKIPELFDRLTLLMANSDNRKMTSADYNQQAERMEAVVVELAEHGFKFPGRLRDWVSELSGINRTKLAKLKVIREGLEPSIKKGYYDNGKLAEETAYQLARLPHETQLRILNWYIIERNDKSLMYFYANTVENYANDLKRIATYTCPEKLGGGTCTNQNALLSKLWSNGYRGYCHCAKGCCSDCGDLATCRSVCEKMKPKADREKKKLREQKKAMREAEEQADKPQADKVRNLWLRFGNALSRANMEDAELRKKVDNIKIYQIDAEKIAKLEAGELPKVKGSTVLPFSNNIYMWEIDRLVQIADALGCSLDYLMCRTDVPEVAAKPVSYCDTPPAELTWHDAAAGDLPEDGVDAAHLIAWGRAGVKSVPGSSGESFRRAYEHWPEEYRWWAEVEGPETRNEEEGAA